MSNVEEYNMKLEVIKAIPDDQIKPPSSIPVEIYIQESEHLLAWCHEDKDELIASGLDWTEVEDLPARCGALREAESKWIKERYTREEAEQLWFLESPKGYELRNVIAHNFYYAFQDSPSLIQKINKILEGSTHAGMIQALNNFSVLGRDNQELLTNIGFDLTLLDLAAQKSDELAPIYAAAYRDREECHLLKAKFEARNPKLETNSNYQNLNDKNKNGSSKWFRAFVLNFEHLNFVFVSDFDIRISDLLVLSKCHSGQGGLQ